MSKSTTIDEDELVEIFVERLSATKSEGTVKHRKSHLNLFRSWLEANDRPPLLDVSRYDIEDHFDTIRKTHPDTTATTRLDAIGAFYRWVVTNRTRLENKHGIVVNREDNPAKGILKHYEDLDPTPKKAQIYDHDIVALTRDEAEKLVADESIPDPLTRNKLLLKILLQTGIRASEAHEIQVDDINREDRRIRIRDQKNSRRRTVFYQPSLDNLLTKWLDGGLRATYATAEQSNHLFLTNKSGALSYNSIHRIVDDAARLAGIQEKMYVDAADNPRWKVTPHTLRHTYARFAVTGDNRMDISRLAELMGHRDNKGNPNISTTKKYLAFREEDLRDASTACIPDI